MQLRSKSVFTYAAGAFRLIVVPAGLLWIFMQAADFGWTRRIAPSPAWILLALILNQLALLIFAARMLVVLRVWNMRIGWISAIRIHFQSLFYFVVVPMTVGMDISRFIKIYAIDPSVSKTNLAAALLMDRIIGALAALVLALFCVPILKFSPPFPLAPPWLWVGLAGAFSIVVATIGWQRSRHEMSNVWTLTSGKRTQLLGLIALSMLMNVTFSAGIQMAAIGLGTPIAFIDALFAVSGGLLLIAIPVSLAGIGPAEAGTAGLLMFLGYDVTSAVTIGALPYLARLVAAVQGGLWEFLDGIRAAFIALYRSGDPLKVTVPAPER